MVQVTFWFRSPSEMAISIDDVMLDESMPILNRLDVVFRLLMADNLLQVAQFAHPSEVLCHQANRGGLGLNPYNVHRVGAKVQRVGANL